MNSDLMLNMEPRLDSMGEMDIIIFHQRYEFTRVPDILAGVQLIWFHPEGLKREMIKEPYNISVASVVLTAMVDLQHRENTDSTVLRSLRLLTSGIGLLNQWGDIC